MAKEFRVVVATDGSPVARAAVAAAVEFPWPANSQASGVLARAPLPATADLTPTVWAAIGQSLERVAAEARRTLRRRWPDAEVAVLDKLPADAILAEARGAQAIVLGSRGHGVVGRLLLGSVSRQVVRSATCPTLVVKGSARGFQHFVIGVDGSANSRRAAAFVALLERPRGARVTLVAVVEPVRVGSMGLMPAGIRATLGREMRAMSAERVRRAQRQLHAAARPLARAGWRVRTAVRTGLPLTELTAAAEAGDVLVVGARGVGGVERLLLGSIAEGVLTRSQVPVVIVR
ncbi:MAG TPA: universal stress protein [Methylomirabilota bacterium]|nr:universal stress protein [Methylomirabilota bacterium]